MSSKEYWLCLPLQVLEIFASVFCTRLVHVFFTERHTHLPIAGSARETLPRTWESVAGSSGACQTAPQSCVSLAQNPCPACGQLRPVLVSWESRERPVGQHDINTQTTWLLQTTHEHTTHRMTTQHVTWLTQQANTVLCESNCNIKQGFMPPCKWWHRECRASFIHKWTKVSDHLPLCKLRQQIYWHDGVWRWCSMQQKSL